MDIYTTNLLYLRIVNPTDQQKPPEDCEHESTGAADCNDEGVFAVLQATVQVHAEEASNHHSEAAGKSSKLNEHCYLHQRVSEWIYLPVVNDHTYVEF